MKHQRVFQEPFMRDYFSLTEPQERRQAILDFMGKEDLLEAGSMYLIFGPQSSDPEGNIVLVAHYDTVFDPQWEKEVIVEGGRWTSPHGLGADDGAGVLALMHLYHYYKEVEPQNMPFFIFTDKEEKGMQGAWELAENSKIAFEKALYFIEIDRRGFKECVFYNGEPENFISYIESFGFSMEYGSGSDISVLGPRYNLCSVNLSAGYYNSHSKREYFVPEHLFYTIERVKEMLRNKPASPFRLK